jgi:anti-sigma factor RsiW
MSAQAVSCQEVVELVTDYLEGRMGAADRLRVERHLELCDGCTEYVEQMRATIRLTGSLRPEDLDPDMRERLLDVFRAARDER